MRKSHKFQSKRWKWYVDIIIYSFTAFLSPCTKTHPSPPGASVFLLPDNASFSPRLRSGIYMKLLIVCSSNSQPGASSLPEVKDRLLDLPPPLSALLSERAPPGWSAWQSIGRSRASWLYPLFCSLENTATINLTPTRMHNRIRLSAV